MRKYLQVTIMFGILLFLVWLRNAKLENDVTANIKPNINTPTITPTATLTISPTSILPTNPTKQNAKPTPTATLTPTPTGMYKNGTYTGSVEDAYYGNVQVQVAITNGKISDITFLQYPNDNHTSQSINSQAIPILITEAIQAQSANVSGVSGASATSPAFQASLSNALAKAKN
jgi:uncharacterized protein with FMN-binding domain